jgi:hypothetical protein
MNEMFAQKKHKKKPMTDEQKAEKFKEDKAQAIEEGYTEDQAVQYANQEQQLRNAKSKKENDKKGGKTAAAKPAKKEEHP